MGTTICHFIALRNRRVQPDNPFVNFAVIAHRFNFCDAACLTPYCVDSERGLTRQRVGTARSSFSVSHAHSQRAFAHPTKSHLIFYTEHRYGPFASLA
jgi:hypothetical protein